MKTMAKAYIYEDKCKGCGLCTTVCPKKVVKINKETLNAKGFNPASITDIDACIGCGFCAMICPDCVIEVKE